MIGLKKDLIKYRLARAWDMKWFNKTDLKKADSRC